MKRLETDRLQRDAIGSHVSAAEKALADAQAALAAGKEPREGERIGTAKGGSRLNEAYFERMKALESAVENARRNLDVARGGTGGPAPVGASSPGPLGNPGPK